LLSGAEETRERSVARSNVCAELVYARTMRADEQQPQKRPVQIPADEKTGEDIVETEASARGDAARNRRAISLSFGQPSRPARPIASRQHAGASELTLGQCARGRDY